MPRHHDNNKAIAHTEGHHCPDRIPRLCLRSFEVLSVSTSVMLCLSAGGCSGAAIFSSVEQSEIQRKGRNLRSLDEMSHV